MDIDEVLEAIELAKEQKLKTLSLSNRGISELPPEIGKLSLVQKLDLSYNYISKIPAEFSRLTNLRSVYFNHNEIEELPVTIGNMKSLTILDLSHNKIESIPESIGDLNNLEHLDLSFNSVKRLPLNLVNLTGLKKLYLENNPSEYPPEKVIRRGLYATMHFLFGEIRKKESAKVMMQVYNMPRDLIAAFSEYINCFNDLVSSAKDQHISFDVKYIKQDFSAVADFDNDMENYLKDFMSFLKSNIGNKTFTDYKKEGKEIVELQLLDLKEQLAHVSKSLNDRMTEMRSLQDKINNLTRVIETK
jgi:Leucine-rich repeat (LRR) protein